jgi:divalent metal cation (Fe/Co/Zn/Cd) transporter
MRRTERTEAIAVGVAVLMAAGMITVALITHSIAIMAEGVDGVIDVVASAFASPCGDRTTSRWASTRSRTFLPPPSAY